MYVHYWIVGKSIFERHILKTIGPRDPSRGSTAVDRITSMDTVLLQTVWDHGQRVQPPLVHTPAKFFLNNELHLKRFATKLR